MDEKILLRRLAVEDVTSEKDDAELFLSLTMKNPERRKSKKSYSGYMFSQDLVPDRNDADYATPRILNGNGRSMQPAITDRALRQY